MLRTGALAAEALDLEAVFFIIPDRLGSINQLECSIRPLSERETCICDIMACFLREKTFVILQCDLYFE